MCMMIYHPATAEPFSLREFADFNNINPNGFGMIWRTASGKTKAHRGFYGPERAWNMYRRILNAGCQSMALHWRFATAGAVTLDNCHPIPVVNGIVLMHNGVLSHRSTEAMSDTRCFVQDVIKPDLSSDPDLLHSDLWIKRIDDRIGHGNKIILWDRSEPEPVVIGAKKGLWYRGRWYSNTYAWSSEVRHQRSRGKRQHA